MKSLVQSLVPTAKKAVRLSDSRLCPEIMKHQRSDDEDHQNATGDQVQDLP